MVRFCCSVRLRCVLCVEVWCVRLLRVRRSAVGVDLRRLTSVRSRVLRARRLRYFLLVLILL